MATWQEAVEWMSAKPTNTASCDALHLYRIWNGHIERTTWKGGNPWVPHIPSVTSGMNWDLTSPF